MGKGKAILYGRIPTDTCKRNDGNEDHHVVMVRGGCYRQESFPPNTKQQEEEHGDGGWRKLADTTSSRRAGPTSPGGGRRSWHCRLECCPERGRTPPPWCSCHGGMAAPRQEGTLGRSRVRITLQKLRPLLFTTVKNVRDRAGLRSSSRRTGLKRPATQR